MVEPFDSPFSTLADPSCSWSNSAPSPLDSPRSHNTFDAILYPTFEREICSNYTCCGLTIPDLHELLAHFEATHVESGPTLTDDAFLQQPPTDALYDAAHLVLSFPQPRPLPEGACPRTPSPCPPALDSMSESATSPASTSGPPSPQEILARATSPEPASPQVETEPVALSPSLLTAPREPAHGPKRVERRGPRGRFQSHENTSTPRKREKSYHCPKPGCLKSYLNPNGLKYHLDKGTCQLAPSST
ncbi:hypothetical protein BC834DRAFT_547881 [Gloeopeniophorella convolvens]|nr:hypothetical protein BC834DRAFT_547881 [Gloeopeniophorella convolvens]